MGPTDRERLTPEEINKGVAILRTGARPDPQSFPERGRVPHHRRAGVSLLGLAAALMTGRAKLPLLSPETDDKTLYGIPYRLHGSVPKRRPRQPSPRRAPNAPTLYLRPDEAARLRRVIRERGKAKRGLPHRADCDPKGGRLVYLGEVHGRLQSDNYVEGESGWQIRPHRRGSSR